ncbi:hypothetical protein I4U23_000518 [Adineta vaga]|nr:hypothetical protein I4U23_000518 [Adineta vaga]
MIPRRLSWLFIVVICILMIIIYVNVIQLSPYRFDISFNYTSKYSYIAVIVDDRATQSLVTVVHNVLQHIPSDWKVQIIIPIQHWLFYNQSSLHPLILTNRIFLTSLEESRNGLSSTEFINHVLTSASFWHQVQGEKVLFFQIDSILCSNSLYNLTDFLEYDFIGAPWYNGGCCNGGLSIRNRHKILQMLESNYVQFRLYSINEDGWFSKNLPYFNGYVAPISIAKHFSVETMYHPRPFGVHNPHLTTIGLDNIMKLCTECPEMKMITSLCKSF